ncbi:ATP-binding protein [Nocardioides terrigena]|uniref:ATP-binding protein n=1 Tax=Nocardioides terrigena TaxID=424797 RepID=UPI00131F1C29|nr:AAA family ATPase [Nocardioides terrigena]
MSALARPELAPGPHRDLVDALHDLHHRAGWPSLRTLARETGVSHTTVSHAFSSPRIASWGTLELLVEAMDGDTASFHDLWLAATTPHDDTRPPTPRIAGRRPELTAVRRHLDSGTGLLLVTGEAGIGKTRLVSTAVESSAPVVLTGHCLPLSSEVPLLPVVDVLRQATTHGDGGWWRDAMASAPAYVPEVLGALLPELDATRPPDDSVGRHLLTPAVGAALTGLAARRPTAVVLEDLHWADAATLDLLTQLLSRGPGVPVVGTWRTHDPTTSPSVAQWFGHVRRGADVTVLDLRPLSADETAEQLLMLGLDPTSPRVAAIHARTAGQPLFTEQLAAHRDDGTALPRFLTDLLDQRFAAIADDAWLVARALGTADRSLPPAHLEVATGLDGDRLVGALRELRRRHLVRSGVDRAQLRHPLLAEAIRRRLVPGEAAGVHRALALALGAEPDAAPAEVANHWQAAGDGRQELTWRIRAARAARERFSVHESARQWARVVEAWPPGTSEAGDPPLSHAEALIRAVEALSMVDVVAAHDLCPRALEAVPGASPLVAAEILIIVANLQFDVRGVSDESLDMAARAVEILERAGPSLVLADALLRRATMLFNAGRLDDAARTSARVVEVCRQIDEPSFLMLALSRRGWYHLALGDVEASRRCFEEARTVDPERCDPYDLVELATNHTDLLLQTGAGADEVVAAAAEALQTAAEYGLDTFIVGMLIANVGQALREAGRVGEAARLVLPASEDAPGADRWPIHIERVNVESALGNADAALERASLLKELRVTSGAHRTYLSRCYAEAHLWAGQPGAALAELLPTLERAVAREDSMLFALALTTAARAGADEAAAGRRPVEAPERHELAARLHRLHGACSRDPFGPHPMIGHGTAARALWCAEIRRLEGRESLDLWTGAAAEWDRLARPHDAAYCRWRGARLALRQGDTTAARGLLERAAVDAREHVPLHRAIATTRVGHP